MNFDPRIFITVGTSLGLDALEEYNTLRMNPSQSLNQYMDFVSFSLLSSIPLWGYNHNCSPIILEDSYISYNFRMKITLLSRKHPGVHSSKKMLQWILPSFICFSKFAEIFTLARPCVSVYPIPLCFDSNPISLHGLHLWFLVQFKSCGLREYHISKFNYISIQSP